MSNMYFQTPHAARSSSTIHNHTLFTYTQSYTVHTYTIIHCSHIHNHTLSTHTQAYTVNRYTLILVKWLYHPYTLLLVTC